MLSENIFNIPHERNFNSANSFTIGTPSVARCAFFPRNEDELIYLVKELKDEKYFVAGIGSNTLPPENYDGFLIFTKNIRSLSSDGDFITAGCGVSVTDVINYAISRDLDCASFMAGIPSSLGGGIYMNAGTKNGYIGDIIERVTVTDGVKIFSLTGASACFRIKTAPFKGKNFIILNARLRCGHASADSVKVKISAYIAARKNCRKERAWGVYLKIPTENPPAR